MRGLVFWFVLLVAGPAMAQEPTVLRGRVLDAETGQPVPSAQVGVANNRIGTSTNADGAFVLIIPATYQHEALEVALLGYRKYAQALPPLPGPELRIRLQISPAALGEVVVTSSVTGIVREAVARPPSTYPPPAPHCSSTVSLPLSRRGKWAGCCWAWGCYTACGRAGRGGGQAV